MKEENKKEKKEERGINLMPENLRSKEKQELKLKKEPKKSREKKKS